MDYLGEDHKKRQTMAVGHSHACGLGFSLGWMPALSVTQRLASLCQCWTFTFTSSCWFLCNDERSLWWWVCFVGVECQGVFGLITKKPDDKDEKLLVFAVDDSSTNKTDFLTSLSKTVCSSQCRTDYVCGLEFSCSLFIDFRTSLNSLFLSKARYSLHILSYWRVQLCDIMRQQSETLWTRICVATVVAGNSDGDCESGNVKHWR